MYLFQDSLSTLVHCHCFSIMRNIDNDRKPYIVWNIFAVAFFFLTAGLFICYKHNWYALWKSGILTFQWWQTVSSVEVNKGPEIVINKNCYFQYWHTVAGDQGIPSSLPDCIKMCIYSYKLIYCVEIERQSSEWKPK